VKTILEVMEERDRCRRELDRPDVVDRWARASLLGALVMAEWVLGKNGQDNVQRPSTLTRAAPPDLKTT